MFCRNCDTAIEVSEGDVSTFESQGSFACPSCKEDLSARMADLLGANRASSSEERTVPEEETADADAFAGLPVGGSLDDAARAMRAPAPAPSIASTGGVAFSSSAGAVPEVGTEDPLSLALRIAQQAQAAALAAAAAAEQAPSNGAHPQSEPIAEPTAPGTPSFTNGAKADSVNPGASSEVGVVPEEPDNEDTVRRAGNATASTVDSGTGADSTITEPTLPSDSDLLVSDTSDSGPVIGEDAVVDEPVGGEETPALTEAQRAALLAHEDENEPDTIIDEPSEPGTNGGIPGGMGGAARKSAIPDSPSAEPTPSAPRPAPLPAEPREEPTIRKTSPPPALVVPPARLVPRTGTGPSGIGALGFRISSNRAVVRPNGRTSSPSMAAAAAPTTPSGGTPMSGSTSIERVSMERPIERPSRTAIPAPRAPLPPVVTTAPEPPPLVSNRASVTADTDRAGVPVWLLGVGAGLAMLLIAGVAYLIFSGGEPDAPVATPTPIGEGTPLPMESAVAVLGTPVATLTPAGATRTPQPTATPRTTPAATATPAPTATAVAIASAPRATPTPSAKSSAKERIDQIVRAKTPSGASGVRFEIYTQGKNNVSDAEFLYEAFKFLASPPTSTPKSDADLSKRLARELGKEYLSRYRITGNNANANFVHLWITAYDKTQPSP